MKLKLALNIDLHYIHGKENKLKKRERREEA